ncbi:MAG: copper amine oxidase N-terminal domain-containing protein [Oscillospiraceae bacterium]|nr:copper amine oxidase N-terminal domain-containing protein [Oscillospiraceae bacterium]
MKGRTLVPLRFISEAFGASVNWNNDTFTVTIRS